MMRAGLVILVVFVISTLFCCGKKAYHYQPADWDSLSSQPQLIFFSANIQRTDSSGAPTMRLIEQKTVAGAAKITRPDGHELPYLVITQLDKDQKAVSSMTHPHPLYTDIEFSDDDHGLHRKKAVLKEAEFFIRMNLHSAAEGIKVEEKVSDGTTNDLLVFTINKK